MNPMLKYRGGKSKELAHFVDHMPQSFDRYVEPFFGGGALFFYLQPEKAIINDVKNQKEYEKEKNKNPEVRVANRNEELYYLMRDAFNHKIKLEYLDSVIYFFINKTAYSGMIRYNAKGEYNVPYGRYKNFNTKLLTQEHYELLKRTEIYNMDYSKIFHMLSKEDFVFLDPPYDCVFSDYGNEDYKDGFGEDEHRRLASDFRNLPCKALLVIGKTSLTEELYGDFIAEEYEKSYSVNIRNRFKADAKHMIVTNY